MLCVSHSSCKVLALQREDPHTRSHVRSGLRFLLEPIGFPFFDGSKDPIPPQSFWAELLHDPYNPRTNFRASNANAAPSTEQPKSHRQKWCVIPAYDSSIISNVIRLKIR